MFGGYSLMFNQHLKQNVDCTGTFDERYRHVSILLMIQLFQIKRLLFIFQYDFK